MKTKFFQDLSLKLKLTFLFSFLLLLISTSIYIYFPAKRENDSVKEIEKKTQVIGLMTAYSISPAIVFDDKTAIEESFVSARQNKELLYLIVVKDDGQIFNSYNLNKAIGVHYKKIYVDFDLSVVKKEIPIYHQSKYIGSLFIGLSLDDVKNEILETRITIGIISIVVFLLGLFAVMGISTYLTKPLDNFIGTIKEIGSGDLDKRVIVSSQDEIGLLANSFNEMLQKLQLVYKELDNLNKSLEARVLERTHELKSSQERYKTLYENSPVMLYSIDNQARIISVSEFWLSNTGYTWEEVIGKKSTDFLTEESREYDERIVFPDFLKSGFCKDVPMQMVKKNGEIIDVLLSATSEKDNEGNVLRSLTVLVDVTEKKKAEEKLRESEERFRSLYENATIGIYRTTPDGKIEMANPTLVKMLGYSSFEDIASRNLEKEGFSSSYDRKYFIERIEKDGKIIGLESEWTSQDGTVVYIRESAKAIRDSNGKTLYYEGAVEDITERRNSEKALRESEQKFRTVVEEAVEIVFTVDRRGYFTYVNPSGLKSSGYSLDELKQLNYMDLVEPKYKQRVSRNYYRQYLEREELSTIEYPFRTKSGEIKWFNQNARLIIENNEVKGFYVIARDITERRKVEEALRKSEEKYRGIFENVQDVYYETSVDGTIIEVSPSVEILSKGKFHRDDLIGKSMNDYYSSPGERQAVLSLLKEHGSVNDYGIVLKNQDGSLVPCSISAKIQFDANGKPLKIIGSIRDITERKRAEEEITMLAHSLRSINECVSITDMDNKILFVNESFLKTYGYDEYELVGKHISIVSSLNSPPGLIKEILSVTIDGGWSGELWNRRKDGSEFPIYLSTTIIKDKDNNPIRLIGVAKDVTDRKRTEKELIEAKERAEQSDRLKSEFLAQMSHEIRTPINVMIGNVDYLKDAFGEEMDSDAKDCFEGIDLSAKRIIRTIDLILNIAELQTVGYEPQFVKIDLKSKILSKLYSEHQLSAKQKGLELTYICKEKNTEIIADEYSVVQIFANLIDNAIKYTKKGKIEILLSKNTVGNNVVEIKDTGIGISEEFQAKLFEPFVQEDQGFKRNFEGNGLGLALVKNYCDINKAVIEVESEKNVGSTFRVTFVKEENEH